jgi:hypothetical protein
MLAFSVRTQMPKDHFHLQGTQTYRDDGGSDLPSDGAAWGEAKRFARNIESTLEPGEIWHLEVCREGEVHLFLEEDLRPRHRLIERCKSRSSIDFRWRVQDSRLRWWRARCWAV